MADAKTTTFELRDDLEDVATKLEYTQAMAALVASQKDHASLPPHQQTAIQAILFFPDEARLTLASVMGRL